MASRALEAGERAKDVDVVVSPTVPIPPPSLGDPDPVVLAGRNARIFNGLGWPALSIPCGFAGGLPVGLQLSAPPD